MPAAKLKSLDNANFRQRVISSLTIAPLALLAVYFGGLIYLAALVLLMTLALREWLRLIDAKMDKQLMIAAYVGLWLTLLAGGCSSSLFGLFVGALATAGLFFFARQKDTSPAWVAAGIPYMGGSGIALFYLHQTPANGSLVYYLLAVVWGTDIGAYVAGRIIGGPKLAPKLSPNKTWAGLLGGMALAVVLGYIAAACFGAHITAIGAGLAVVLAVLAQCGDLFESNFKRRSGAKESGKLIPGHGGVLDRIDGLVFAAIALALFQTLIGADMQWW
ncbi:MAG TPA: phosphatidate cytidylyltransferase [Alphaproteobacteria bacterium]|nr:phosphatidate cytidylyltransferase [Alphaproteobacteria bacterium]